MENRGKSEFLVQVAEVVQRNLGVVLYREEVDYLS